MSWSLVLKMLVKVDGLQPESSVEPEQVFVSVQLWFDLPMNSPSAFVKSAESGIVHESSGFDLDVHGTFPGAD